MAGSTNLEQDAPKKQIILNAFDFFAGSHLSHGQWRNPKDRGINKFTDLSYWTNLAQILERGDITSLFLADDYGQYDIYKESSETAIRGAAIWPKADPIIPISAMAAVTTNLSFALTGSTTYETPFTLARRYSTMDNLLKGRFGWNIVTSFQESGARLIGEEMVEHDKRYKIADDFVRILYKLWEGSWADDALNLDADREIYTNPDRVRYIHHDSEYFKLDGPHSVPPSPQRTPFLFQAGTSKAGIEFGALHAEAIFVAASSPYILAPRVKQIREAAAAAGRDPQSVKVVAILTPIIGHTHEEAVAKYEEAQKYASVETTLAFWSGNAGIDLSKLDLDKVIEPSDSSIDHRSHSLADAYTYRGTDIPPLTPRNIAKNIAIGADGPTPVGTAEEVADLIEQWIEIADLDGFNIAQVLSPASFEDVVDLLVPELRKRGRYPAKGESVGRTLRERIYGEGQSRLREDHIGYTYRHENSDRYAEQDKLPRK
ncbi:DszA family Xenobiotic compound monooxygenase [Phlyctema vagabunda]|uniref:DszA family Xenobiotic compound monooxygenase n=1 Tax=Phlyctema vagabunda TaxID=108571 RepID=A0ABR4PQH2_9HELO